MLNLLRAVGLYALVIVTSVVFTPTLVVVIFHSSVDQQGLLIVKFFALMVLDVWLFLVACKYAFRYITSSM